MAIIAGLRPYDLETKTFASKGNPIIDISPLPAGYRLRNIIASLEDGTFTQGAAGTAALITGDKLALLFSKVTHDNFMDADGVLLRFLEWMQGGRDFDLPADLPATADGVFKRSPRIVIPFSDQSMAEPNDCAPRVELYRNKNVQLNLADTAASPFNVLAAAAVAGTLKFTANIEPAPAGVVNAQQDIGRADFEGHTLIHKKTPRAYTQLFLYKTDGTAFTSAELATISLKVDGEYLYRTLTLQQLASVFNLMRASGSGVQTTSATAPDGGEVVTDQPAAAAAGSGTTVPFVPLYCLENAGKVSKALWAREQVAVETTGTLTTGFKLGYRSVVHQDREYDERAIMLGYKPGAWRSKTYSKNTLAKSARVAGLIGRRYGA
jgi:hypothetical protein